MKKRLVVVAVLVTILSFSTIVGAEGMTARTFGMGEAFTGVADDLGAILFNPAGLNESGFIGLQLNGGLGTNDLDKFRDLMDFSEVVGDDSVSDVLAVVPDNASLQTHIFAGGNFKSFGLAVNTGLEASSTNSGTSGTVSLSTRSEGIISLGRKLTSPPLNLGALSYGINAKMIKVDNLNYEISATSITEEKMSGTGFDLDLGVLAKVTDYLKVGVQVKNIIAPEITLTGTETEYSYSDSSWNDTVTDENLSGKWSNERTMRVGAALSIPVINLTLAADIDRIAVFSSTADSQVLHFGVEKNLFFNALSLRAGSIVEEELTTTTFGLGLNLTGFHLDVAVGSSDNFQNSITGLLSANIKF